MRIEERRLPVLATLMAYLEDKEFFSTGSSDRVHLEYSDKNAIAKAAKELVLELKLQDHSQEDIGMVTHQLIVP